MEKKGRNVGLDIIRVIAMAAVLLVHLTIYLPIPGSLKPFFTWGASGVQLFFVLSGYLVCYSFEKEVSFFTYYKKRALRILPAYYVAVVAVLMFHQFVLQDVTVDIFGIGWLRYFFGLNTVLPSTNYSLWNNICGFWTMSCFIWFYVMAPFIFKLVKSLKSSVILLVCSIVLFFAWKLIIYTCFGYVEGLETLDVLTGASPLGMLYQFAIGIMTFFFLKEKKSFEGIIALSCLAVIGLILSRKMLIWCAVCGIWIIAAEHVDIRIKPKFERAIKRLSTESYHVYLAHFLALDISEYVVRTLLEINSAIGYILWGVISAILLLVLIWVMCVVEKIVFSMVARKLL